LIDRLVAMFGGQVLAQDRGANEWLDRFWPEEISHEIGDTGRHFHALSFAFYGVQAMLLFDPVSHFSENNGDTTTKIAIIAAIPDVRRDVALPDFTVTRTPCGLIAVASRKLLKAARRGADVVPQLSAALVALARVGPVR
jgi:hypothetical protein